ncbi:transglycosylase domain-containing protein [Streptomyces noursei]|uniref:transglycosylase domain-containing protein n=1 Tax=Streptomyces noursei TaxID=1971 RepID=UPI0035D65BA3
MEGRKKSRRYIDYPRLGRKGVRRWLPSWRLWSGTCTFVLACLGGLFAFVYAKIDVPNENALAGREGTVYYWADGSQMVTVGTVNRQNVTLDKVPKHVQNAVIAAENATFYEDHGVSLTGIARAVVNMVSGGDTQGGSTITQQYVKNTYLSPDQTATRKVKEFIIALKVNNQKSKSDILRGYLNTSWFGRGSNGIQAAAHAYYGIDAKDLDPSQGALLAAVLKGSEQYDPGLSKANHARAVDRWKWILDRLVDTGAMSKEERAHYRTFPEPRPVTKPTSQAGQIGYLVDVANKFVKSTTGLTDKDLARGGYRVHTTFEKQRTRRLEKAVNDVRTKSLDAKKRTADSYVEFGAASVRPDDGAIVALYGGADATRHFSNNADTTAVPAGSAFKPIVLATALQQEAERYGDQPRPADGSSRSDALLGALMQGSNVPFVQGGKQLGLEQIRDLALSLGLRKESLAQLEQTFPLGTSAPSAVRLASAYSTFANAGRHAEPYAVSTMTYQGKAVAGFERPEPQQAVTPEVAQTMTNMLAGLGWRTLPSGLKAGEEPPAVAATEPGDRMKSAWFVATPPPAGGGWAKGVRPAPVAGAGVRADPTTGAGKGGEPTTAITLFRNKPGAPQLLPLNGVGGPDTGLGTSLPPRVWTAYQGAA